MSRKISSAAFLAALVLLSSCGKNDNQKKETQSANLTAPAPVAKPDEQIPMASLPRVATPNHYALTVTIDPKRDRFSGHAEIDVTFNTARKTMFIDGNEIHMKSVMAILPSGKKVPAGYAQVDPSGVAYLNFAE